jgi:3-methyladenine DNA glycosylase Tag
MILAKRDGFREVFSNWEIDAVAAMGPGDLEALRQNTGII